MSQTSTTTPTTKIRKNFLTYPYDYYAGQHARIFFGHIWVDDVVTIQYSLSQNKSPIFGYASQQFDAIAKGQIMVNGNFTLAFKETGYLNLIHNRLKGIQNTGKEKSKEEILTYWLNKNKPIEQVLDELYMREEGTGKPWTDKDGVEHLGSDFEDLAESLEDYVWGNFNNKNRQITRPDAFDYTDERGNESSFVDIEGFDIVMTFGDYTNDVNEHTVKVINDVHITSESMVITPDGSPLGLNYQFFARGIDEKISTVFSIPEEKRQENVTGNNEIDNKLDAQYPTLWYANVIEVIDKDNVKVGALTNQDVHIWLKKQPEKTLVEVKSYNVNVPESMKQLRDNIIDSLKNIIESVDFEKFDHGTFGIYGAGIKTIKISIKLLLNGVPAYKDDGSKIEGSDSIGMERTMQPIVFNKLGTGWINESNDSKDLPKYSRNFGTDQFEMLSENQLNAEIRSTASFENLKKIFGSNSLDVETRKSYEEKREKDKASEKRIKDFEDLTSTLNFRNKREEEDRELTKKAELILENDEMYKKLVKNYENSKGPIKTAIKMQIEKIKNHPSLSPFEKEKRIKHLENRLIKLE